MTTNLRRRARTGSGGIRRTRAAALGVVAAAAVVGPLAALPGYAGAATSPLPQNLRVFSHCPIGNKKVTACLYASQQGTFVIGSTTISTSKPTVISLGIISTAKGNTVVLPTDGTLALTAAPVYLPGGLAGFPGAPSVGPDSEVTATPFLAGLPTLDLPALFQHTGAAFTLPIYVAVGNPLLGTSCTIGTTSAPITLQLTDGTTAPPPPNTPISGKEGSVAGNAQGELVFSNQTLVDNSFAAPGTSGCGPDGLADPAINEAKGLPAAAGTNSVVLNGTTRTVSATEIRKYLG